MRTKGFTLIELLIVVAIIAILAAIAVPNFLEAQARAKVSRVKADMRTVATALEAYAVDERRVPIGPGEAAALEYADGTWPQWSQSLTTPVAYLTSIPRDPFLVKGGLSSEGQGFDAELFRYVAQVHSIIDQQAKNNSARRAKEAGFIWGLGSFGPSRNKSHLDGATANLAGILAGKDGTFIYDPSNGTVSRGYIIRTNKGELQASQLNLR